MATLPPPVLDVLRPVIRAYTLVYLSTSSFQVVRLVPAILAKKKDVRWFVEKVIATLRDTTGVDRFPACAAFLIAASTIIPRFVTDAIPILQKSTGLSLHAGAHSASIIRFVSVYLASVSVFQALNRGTVEPLKSTEITAGYAEAITTHTGNGDPKLNCEPAPPSPITPQPPVGKTLFITSFAVVHASTVVGSIALNLLRGSSPKSSLKHVTATKIGEAAPSMAFILSSAVIMWTWFFTPERLPKEYQRWITSASQADMRLVRSIRSTRLGLTSYGKQSNYKLELPDMAKDYGLPAEWGDHVKTIPIPCELVHCGYGPSCEVHAIRRFAKGWVFAMRMYLPLNMFFVFQKKPNKDNLLRAFVSASRSSAFLGAFMGFFYYGICLGRTRLGPLLVGKTSDALTYLESNACLGAACSACGLSILIERPSRRDEMALFVAPRALSALLPRRYDRSYMWIEQFAFASSVATILTVAMSVPKRVHGVFGRLLSKVYK